MYNNKTLSNLALPGANALLRKNQYPFTMDKKILEKHNMFTNVNEVFNDNMSTINTVLALKAQVTTFQTGYAMLNGMMQPLLLDSTGHAKAKAKAKQQLSRTLARVCGAMRSYAEDEGDSVLFVKANYSPSELLLSRDLELQQIGQALYDLANGLSVELVPYGIGSAELAVLLADVYRFTELNPVVRQVKVDNKTQLALLKAKVKELNDLLRFKLDNSMLVMETIQFAFYELYRNARRNYTLGVRHEQPEMALAVDVPIAAPKAVAAPPSESGKLSVALQDMGAMNGNGMAV